MQKVSAALITLNEESRIREALESLHWVDEIVVLDFQSEDRTVDICREFTDRVYQEPWNGFVYGRNRSMELASHQWILSMDADERVTPDLREEIARELSADTIPVSGFMINRKMIYMGKWVRHCGWYPDAKLRLFLRNRARWVGGAVHEKCVVEGRVKNLKNPLLHYSYDTPGHHLRKMDYYTDLDARQRFSDGRNVSLFSLLFSPPWTFFNKYVIQLGFLDGWAGFTACQFAALSTFLKRIKLRELHRLARANPDGIAESDVATAKSDRGR